jgi:hypothetical protein
MSPVRIVTSQAQQPITVNALINDPLLLPERIIRVLEGQFAMDRILRDGGNVTGGALMFRTASGLFAEQASEIVNPGAEIPLATIVRGDIDSAPVQKRGLAVEIDREMRIRNAIGEIDRQIQVVRNTLVRDVDGAFVTRLRAAVPAGNVRAATAAWSGGTATIRKDINAVKLAIQQYQGAGTGSGYSGYDPTHLLISPATATNIINSDEVRNMVLGTTAPSNDFTSQGLGEWAINLLGLRPIVTPGVLDTEAFVVERLTVGAYADEIPLESTELYEFRPRQVWRSDTVRSSVGAIDNPGAVGRITGV